MKPILLLIVCILTLSACTQYQAQSNNEKPLAEPEGTPTWHIEPVSASAQEEAETITESPIYFVRDSNIYTAKSTESTEQKITNYPANPPNTPAKDKEGNEIPFYSYRFISAHPTGLLAYGACATTTGNYGCGIYTANDSEVTKVPVNFNARALLQSGTFLDQDTFAYAFEESKEDGSGNWRIMLHDNARTTTLLNYAYKERFGRGGSFDDAQLMQFSADGKHILHVNTASPRNSLDYNIHIYPTNGLSPVVIGNATQPAWIDAQTIIYRSLAHEVDAKAGLYTYSLANKQSTVLVPAQSSLNTSSMYWPRVSPDAKHISAFDYNNQVTYIINLESKIAVAEIKNAVDAVWVGNDTLLYAKTGGCSDGVCGQLEYSYRGNATYSLKTKQSTDTHNISQDAYLMTTFWQR